MNQRNLQRRAAISAPSRGDLLDSYYRDVAERGLLSAAQQKQLSLTIELRQIDAWVEMLSFPRATGYVLERVGELIELDEIDTAPLTRAARATIKTRRVAQQHRLDALARVFAGRMRELDPDEPNLATELAALGRMQEEASDPTGAKRSYAEALALARRHSKPEVDAKVNAALKRLDAAAAK